MLGQTLVGSRLHDVRSVLRYLRIRADLDAGRVALWGDSFALVNPGGLAVDVPLDADPSPHRAEPLGGLLALFTALFEDDARAVYVRGCVTGFESLLQSPVPPRPARLAGAPGRRTAGDLCDVAALLAPRPLRLDDLVDGDYCAVAETELARVMESAGSSYRAMDSGPRLQLVRGRCRNAIACAGSSEALQADPARRQSR